MAWQLPALQLDEGYAALLARAQAVGQGEHGVWDVFALSGVFAADDSDVGDAAADDDDATTAASGGTEAGAGYGAVDSTSGGRRDEASALGVRNFVLTRLGLALAAFFVYLTAGDWG